MTDKKRFPRKTEIVFIEALGRDANLYEVTLGYLSDVENGSVDDCPENSVFAMSDITDDELRMLSQSTVAQLHREIFVLTYGEAAWDAVTEHGEDEKKK
jgi:hypothetical protein